MAYFYGQLVGKSRSITSRQGSRASGLGVTLRSYEGEVRVALVHNHKDGNDHLVVAAGPHSFDRWDGKVIFSGPVADLARGVPILDGNTSGGLWVRGQEA